MAADSGDDSDLANPQSWNKYAYVRNNPIKTIDPEGKQGVPTNQQQLQQMTTAALAQQAVSMPQAQAEGAQAQLDTAASMATATGQAVCEVPPVMGDVAGDLSTAALASTPATGPAGLVAAGDAAVVGTVADGVAFVRNPTPETAGTLSGDIVGG